jgi:hypothetical protein
MDEFVSRDHLARALQEHDQDLERLVVELNLDALFPQLSGAQVDFKYPEADKARTRRYGHIGGESCLG